MHCMFRDTFYSNMPRAGNLKRELKGYIYHDGKIIDEQWLPFTGHVDRQKLQITYTKQ